MEQIRETRGTDILSLISAHRRSIMGFAALAIFVFHKHTAVFTNIRVLGFAEDYLKRIAFLGVDIFLLLSGVGLCYAIRKDKLVTFWLRRLKRVLLPFLITGLIVAITEHWSAKDALGNLTGYYFYTKSMYSFLWYFPAIVSLYLLFPLYHKLLRLSKSPLAFTGIALVLWLLGEMLLVGPMKAANRTEFYGFLNRIPVFLIGVLFGELAHGRRLYVRWPGWVLLALTAVLGLYLAYMTNYQKLQLLVPEPNCCIPNILLAVSLTCLLAKGFDLLSRARAVRWLGRAFDLLGIVSLELYAVQRFVMKTWAGVFPWSKIVALKNLTLFVITVATAAALYWLCRDILALLALPFRKKQA